MNDFSGKRIANYELREWLGGGGMGDVYRAWQVNLEREVAFKILKSDTEPDLVKRFIQEAKIVAQLEHPHIVPIHDYGTHRFDEQTQLTYLVIRLLTGGSLDQRLKQDKQFDLSEVTLLTQQLSSALAHAHAKGIIHRDVKPSNVMFDEYGTVFLVDFGIAKIKNTLSQLTDTGRAIGTPQYMSPEQWGTDIVTIASDQYSLAVMVYEILSGQLPFSAPDIHVFLRQVLYESPTSILQHRSDLPTAVWDVLERALDKSAANRYPSISEFAKEVTKALNEKPISSERKSAITSQKQAEAALSNDIIESKASSQILPLAETPSPVSPQDTILTPSSLPHISTTEPSRSTKPQRNSRKSFVYLMIAAVIVVLLLGGGLLLPPLLNNSLLGSSETEEVQPTSTTEVEESTVIAIATPTPTLTPTPTATDGIAQTQNSSFVLRNDDWVSIERYFDGVAMVQVPAGCFTMGSSEEQIDYVMTLDAANGREFFAEETPTTTICFRETFWLDKYEITNGQFEQLDGQAARISNSSNQLAPRDNVTWFEARDYCELRGGRLPTEAEWEYAARGPDSLIFTWGNTFIADNVIYSGNRNDDVYSRPSGASWVDAVDMSGSVWEWTSTLYQSYPYETDTNHYILDDGRENTESSGDRVLRGGSEALHAYDMRAAKRGSLAPGNRDGYFYGFRCARDDNE